MSHSAEREARRWRAALVVGRCGLASPFVLGGVAKVLAPAPYLEMMRAASLEPAGPCDVPDGSS